MAARGMKLLSSAGRGKNGLQAKKLGEPARAWAFKKIKEENVKGSGVS